MTNEQIKQQLLSQAAADINRQITEVKKVAIAYLADKADYKSVLSEMLFRRGVVAGIELSLNQLPYPISIYPGIKPLVSAFESEYRELRNKVSRKYLDHIKNR